MKKSILTFFAFAFFAFAASAQFDNAYFTYEQLPNSVKFLPAPPDTTAACFSYDLSQYFWGKSMRPTPRGREAARNAVYGAKAMVVQFSVPFGYEISEQGTPAIYRLIDRTLNTLNLSTVNPKKHFMRTRPYAWMNEPSLVPEEEELLRHNGSYPSGHTTLGWGLALLLVELNPEAQDAILDFGYQWGQSRVIAGYHWQSDVDAARLLASATIARMHTSCEFQADFKAAKTELEKLKTPKN